MSAPFHTRRAQWPQLLGVAIDSAKYPVQLTAIDEALRCDTGAAARWVDTHRADLNEMLLEFGVLSFRGFGIASSEDFGKFLSTYQTLATGYAGGTSERATVTGAVMEATRAPPEREILLHQEMAYTRDFPKHIAFYCERPAASGGETLIGDVRDFTKLVDPTFYSKIKVRGLRYERFFRDSDYLTGHEGLDTLHRTWQAAFNTTDRTAAETACAASGSECMWTDHGLLASFTSPGWIVHPVTGEELWFNQVPAYAINRQSVGATYYNLYATHYSGGRRWPQRVTFGDGEEIEPAIMQDLTALWSRVQTAPTWHRGDVMLLDNILTAHGRATFTGERQVRVMLLM